MTIQQLPIYTGEIPALGQEQSEFNTNVSNKLAYDAQLIPAQNIYATEANALAAGVENSAADAASSAAAAASNSNFKGNWSDATGVSNIPASYRHNGKNWQQLQNIADITTQEPSENSFWTELSNVTESFVQNTASRSNLLSNHNFLTPSPDAITHPNPTPESYVAGTQIFSNVYAGSSGCTITLIDGRVNCTAGDYQFKVPNTGGLERVPVFTSSVSDYDGIAKTTGVSHALVSGEYVVTVTPSAGNVFSVKFEQGSSATGHEVGGISSRNLSDYTDVVFDSIESMLTGNTKLGGKYTVAGSVFHRRTGDGSSLTDFFPLSGVNAYAWGVINSSDTTHQLQAALLGAEQLSQAWARKITLVIEGVINTSSTVSHTGAGDVKIIAYSAKFTGDNGFNSGNYTYSNSTVFEMVGGVGTGNLELWGATADFSDAHMCLITSPAIYQNKGWGDYPNRTVDEQNMTTNRGSCMLVDIDVENTSLLAVFMSSTPTVFLRCKGKNIKDEGLEGSFVARNTEDVTMTDMLIDNFGGKAVNTSFTRNVQYNNIRTRKGSLANGNNCMSFYSGHFNVNVYWDNLIELPSLDGVKRGYTCKWSYYNQNVNANRIVVNSQLGLYIQGVQLINLTNVKGEAETPLETSSHTAYSTDMPNGVGTITDWRVTTDGETKPIGSEPYSIGHFRGDNGGKGEIVTRDFHADTNMRFTSGNIGKTSELHVISQIQDPDHDPVLIDFPINNSYTFLTIHDWCDDSLVTDRKTLRANGRSVSNQNFNFEVKGITNPSLSRVSVVLSGLVDANVNYRGEVIGLDTTDQELKISSTGNITSDGIYYTPGVKQIGTARPSIDPLDVFSTVQFYDANINKVIFNHKNTGWKDALGASV